MTERLRKLPQWIGFLIILTILSLGTTLTAFSPLYANGLINIVIPICILIFLRADFFEKLKLSTLVIGRILVVLTFLGYFPSDWLVPVIVWLLRINILEATLTDFKNKSFYNVVSGLVLIATSFVISGAWLGSYYITVNEAMIFWAIAYTLWNWDFVIYAFKQPIGFYHIAVLTTPLLLVCLSANPGLWLIMRANSLTFAGIFQISGKAYIESYLASDAIQSFIIWIKRKPIQISVMLINVILCLVAVLFS
ncbi:hypothetical protein A8709_28705 [Paenibacillus pectinilyticus]|uniref:Uncharacterized protein n=1 Tax=Paenibacillus pectinilyticus TaxID=512399 RepID=A0A1C0ZUS1_9BACL|nr:hypothetical protein [Paenibacillus pectinilyticus]OCT11850.1 hypothetical protein A8709_28705 [Paenibacillus pectinilyticus]